METMVPMPGEGQKPSKATILQSTIEHIQALETDSTELTDEATRLRGEINALRVSFRCA
jgi:hypothetical protein